MFPFVKSLKLFIWAFFYDEKKFERWMRSLFAAVAMSGATWADQAETFAPHKLVLGFKAVCWVVAIVVAAKGSPIKVDDPNSP